MGRVKFLFLIFILLLPIMSFTFPVAAAEENEATLKNETYRIRIEASQWEFKAYDLNAAEDKGYDLNDPADHEKATEEGMEMKHRIHLPEKGKSIEFTLLSRDVQHGFSINELQIAVALNRQTPGQEFGPPSTISADLPNEDVIYSAFCHIFCGLGHPDMKIKFVIGAGEFEIGPYVFYAAIAINVAIFGFTVNSITTKLQAIEAEEAEE